MTNSLLLKKILTMKILKFSNGKFCDSTTKDQIYVIDNFVSILKDFMQDKH